MAKKITSKEFNQIRDLKKAELSNILFAYWLLGAKSMRVVRKKK